MWHTLLATSLKRHWTLDTIPNVLSRDVLQHPSLAYTAYTHHQSHITNNEGHGEKVCDFCLLRWLLLHQKFRIKYAACSPCSTDCLREYVARYMKTLFCPLYSSHVTRCTSLRFMPTAAPHMSRPCHCMSEEPASADLPASLPPCAHGVAQRMTLRSVTRLEVWQRGRPGTRQKKG